MVLTRDKEKLLDRLDEISLKLHRISTEVDRIIDELDPSWRMRRSAAIKGGDV